MMRDLARGAKLHSSENQASLVGYDQEFSSSSGAQAELAALRKSYFDEIVPPHRFEKTLSQETQLAENRSVIYHFMKEGVAAIETKKAHPDIPQALYLHCCREDYTSATLKEIQNAQDEDPSSIDAFIAVSEHVAASFRPIFGEKVHAVINGIDTDLYTILPQEEFLKKRAQLGLDPEDNVALYIGRPSNIKGREVLMYMLSRYEQENDPNIKFVFALSGSEKEKLLFANCIEELAPQLVGEGKVKVVLDISKHTMGASNPTLENHFLEQTPWRLRNAPYFAGVTTFPIHQIADVTLIPSLREALSLSQIEAFACGQHVVAIDSGGVSEVASKDPYSRLISVDTPVLLNESAPRRYDALEDAGEQFCLGIDEILAMNNTAEVRQQTRKMVQENGFTSEGMARKVIQIMEQIRS